ncbi:rod shape-determining protein [Isorropodon fossajaponicum symbiont]|uniref:rod shape-determining protein n=1 Tax=Isorropodon fossajaponicum symbiont TaxID=883811 RepID=UPI001914FC47|nr:rod shape-determining protein [Isorropodon fossajaponicum symbiont]
MFKLFKPKSLSIDLGTVNTLIYLNNKLVLNESSVVAVRDDERLSETKMIADFTITKKMLQHFIHQVLDAKIFSPSPNVLICVPCGATQVERRAIKESAVEAGARNVFLPVKFTMTSAQVLSALKEPLKAIISSIRDALEKTPPELSADIAKNGVMLTGGGALLEGLDKLIKDQANLNLRIAQEPLNCVARGGALALDLIDKHKMNFLSTE